MFLGAVFAAFAYLPLYVGLPLGFAIFFAMHHVRIIGSPIRPYSNRYFGATDRYPNLAPYQGLRRHRLKVSLLRRCYRCEFDLRRLHLARAAVNRYVGFDLPSADLGL